jgi:hypothetical protein
MQLRTTERNARLQVIKDALGAGGKLKIYTGTAPGVGNAATGTLLCTLTALTLGVPAAGAMSVAATADTAAAASGTPGYYRLAKSDDTAVVEGPAGVGSGEANFNATVSAGGTVSLTSGTINEANA